MVAGRASIAYKPANSIGCKFIKISSILGRLLPSLVVQIDPLFPYILFNTSLLTVFQACIILYE